MVETLSADNSTINNTHNATEDSGSCPFEGPEKLLEIWFAPTPGDDGARDSVDKRVGLRTVDRGVWEDMLDVVKCKVLSVVIGREMDAYLLRLVQPKSLFTFFSFLHAFVLIASHRYPIHSGDLGVNVSQFAWTRNTFHMSQRVVLFRLSTQTHSKNMRDDFKPPGASPHSHHSPHALRL
jgi:hypothetical protein